LELVVVDDGSTDDSAALAGPLADTLIPSERRGASGARNLGALHATGDVLVFTDADVVVPSHAFTVLQEVFGAAEAPDAVQGVYAAACPHHNAASQYKNLYYHYSWTKRVRNPRLASAASFFLAIRKDVFVSLGGFDERIHAPTVEDADLGYRLVRSGGSIVLDTRLEVVHDRRYGLAELLRYDCRLAAAKTRFMLRRVVDRDVKVVHPSDGWAVSTARAGEMKAWLASLGLLPLGVVAAAVRLWLAAALSAAGIVILHLPFLSFVAREQGVGLACKTVCITFADAAVVDAGIVWGLLSFLVGRRY
jgi:glycosyltransferase involved in cell wall biosynthesis